MSSVLTQKGSYFCRDRKTWFFYLILAIFGFKQSVLGSVLPFLRDQLHYDTLQVGWHFSFYAAGLVLSGLIAGFLLNRLPIDVLVRASSASMILAVLSIIFVASYPGTLAVAFTMGLTGGIVQAAVQAGIAWHQDNYRDVAMVEAFIFAGIGVFFGPLLVGQFAAVGLGWRLALLIPAVVMIALLIIFREGIRVNLHSGEHHDTRPTSAEQAPTNKVIFPVMLCWLMVLLGIAAEWGLGFWGAQFLESRLGLAPATAVSLMSLFFGGTVFGRLVSSRLLSIFDGRTMLFAVIFLGGGAILTLWGVAHIASTVVALAVAGMCLGNFFPLILSNGIRLAPDRIGLISVGATQAVGIALLIVPLTLGYIGERIGLVNAIGMLVAMPASMAIALYIAGRIHPVRGTTL